MSEFDDEPGAFSQPLDAFRELSFRDGGSSEVGDLNESSLGPGFSPPHARKLHHSDGCESAPGMDASDLSKSLSRLSFAAAPSPPQSQQEYEEDNEEHFRKSASSNSPDRDDQENIAPLPSLPSLVTPLKSKSKSVPIIDAHFTPISQQRLAQISPMQQLLQQPPLPPFPSPSPSASPSRSPLLSVVETPSIIRSESAPTPSNSLASYNAAVRKAKAAEAEEDWVEAFKHYSHAAEVRKPTAEALEKKLRILSRRIEKLNLCPAEPSEEEQQQQLPVEREPAYDMKMVQNGKFAFDSRYDCYRVLNSPSASSSSSSPSTISSHSPLISTYSIPSPLFNQLYPYQRDTLAWLWGLHQQKRMGGVLGDDMGLGKTVQIASYLAGLFHTAHLNRSRAHLRGVREFPAPKVLLIAPLSVLGQWKKELEKWTQATQFDIDAFSARRAKFGSRSTSNTTSTPFPRLHVLTSNNVSKSRKEAEERFLQAFLSNDSSSSSSSSASSQLQLHGGIILTSYGLISSRPQLFTPALASAPGFDYVILDEGHKIKNPDTNLFDILSNVVRSQHRVLLTGTPILNDLQEIWSLFNFVSHGQLFSDRKGFTQEYNKPILAGIAKGATKSEKQNAEALSLQLREKIAPFFLRRDKSILQQQQEMQAKEQEQKAASSSSTVPASLSSKSSSSSIIMQPHAVPRLNVQKNELIVWLHLSPLQISLYSAFLSSDVIKAIFTSQTRSPLVALAVLKKICDHPRLLSEEMKLCEGIGEEIGALPALPMVRPSKDKAADASSSSSSLPSNGEDTNEELRAAVRVLTEESSKFLLLERLITSHIQHGHRTLIFSQSRKMLSMISLLLQSHGWKFLRIDGAISDPFERQKRMELFNKDTSYQCFLLTTRAGGVGLNLVGADRVIIFDPDWTPSLDSQAVDRAYRLGQTRNCVVYRFITCGTVEEVIYRKQVFKSSLIRTATGTKEKSSEQSSSSEADGITRYFSSQELREVFEFSDPFASNTYTQLQIMHPPSQRKTYESLEQHIDDELLPTPQVHGITDHDLLFQAIAAEPSDVDAATVPGTPSSNKPYIPGSARRGGGGSKGRAAAVASMIIGGDDFPEDNLDAPQSSKKGIGSRTPANKRVQRSSTEFLFDLTQDSPSPSLPNQSFVKSNIEVQKQPIINNHETSIHNPIIIDDDCHEGKEDNEPKPAVLPTIASSVEDDDEEPEETPDGLSSSNDDEEDEEEEEEEDSAETSNDEDDDDDFASDSAEEYHDPAGFEPADQHIAEEDEAVNVTQTYSPEKNESHHDVEVVVVQSIPSPSKVLQSPIVLRAPLSFDLALPPSPIALSAKVVCEESKSASESSTDNDEHESNPEAEDSTDAFQDAVEWSENQSVPEKVVQDEPVIDLPACSSSDVSSLTWHQTAMPFDQLTVADQQRYQSLLAAAHDMDDIAVEEHRTEAHALKQLELLLEACAICDSDLTLQANILHRAHLLQFLDCNAK